MGSYSQWWCVPYYRQNSYTLPFEESLESVDSNRPAENRIFGGVAEVTGVIPLLRADQYKFYGRSKLFLVKDLWH